MINKDDILKALERIIHPEAKQSLVEAGFISGVAAEDSRIAVTLKFRRTKDPFAASLRRQAEAALSSAFPGVEISVTTEEPAPSTVNGRVSSPTGAGLSPNSGGTVKAKGGNTVSRRLPGVAKIIAVASGKGGVGKSSVAAYLAATLASEGYRVGILDADIYGPSQPQLFGVANYLPPAGQEGETDLILPAESMGVKVMSIGFFIDPSDALVWRGPMATNALRQLMLQTKWGDLDFLLIDLPPGTGDVHLTVVHELELDGAVIVSTPQQLAVADVRRGVEMFRAEGIGVPILGIVENMAWFTPAELPGKRYYIFGEGGSRRFAEAEGLEFLGDIPIVQSVTDSGETGLPSQGLSQEARPYYVNITRRIVDKLSK